MLQKAIVDARAKGWVHVTSSNTTRTNVLTTVAGPDRGTQRVALDSVSGLIIVVPGATYIKGSAVALTRVFAVPAAAASKVANRWIRLTSKDPEYAKLTAGVTLPSFLGELRFTAPLTVRDYSHAGTTYLLIAGKLSPAAGVGAGNGVLLLTKSSHPLPVRFVTVGKAGAAGASFGHWGASQSVSAPRGAVPLPSSSGGASTAAATQP